LALVDEAMRELATTNRTKLAGFLHVQTPTTLTRRVERCLERYPELGSDFTRVARTFSVRGPNTQEPHALHETSGHHHPR
jgi:hypothetical protein